jgi:hypothetical protein
MFRLWLISLNSTPRLASIRSQMRSYGLSRRSCVANPLPARYSKSYAALSERFGCRRSLHRLLCTASSEFVSVATALTAIESQV